MTTLELLQKIKRFMMPDPDRWSEERLDPKATTEEMSPSGKYRLVTRYYNQGKGYWSYSRGTVYRGDELVCDVKRNYSTFHHNFVTKNGQEWLITGRKYMGQTIVNLDTATEYENNDGSFCWSSARLSPDENMLVVEGCHWACPYEVKLFDFTDPSKGWEELPITTLEEYVKHGDDPEKVERKSISADETDPEFDEQGRIVTLDTAGIFIPTGQREDDMSDEDTDKFDESVYDDEANWRREADVRTVLERRGRVVLIAEQWLSERRKEANRKRAEWTAMDNARKKEWQANDPLWAELHRLLENDPDLRVGSYWWVHPSRNDIDGGEKNPAFFYPYIDAKDPNIDRRAQLKWGVIEGSLSAELWLRGRGSSSEKFERSPDGVQRAIEAVRQHLKGS